MEIEKYVDEKIVQVINITSMKEIVVNDNKVDLYLMDDRIIKFSFENFKMACKGLKLIKEKMKKDEWQKEFDDLILYNGFSDNTLDIINHDECLEYIGLYDSGDLAKVKIKCKDGMIQIERIGNGKENK